MKILKWLTFVVLFAVSLSASIESTTDDSFSDSTEHDVLTTEDFTTDDSIDKYLITERSASDYPSTFEDSASDSTFDYSSFSTDSENSYEPSAIKNLLYPPYDRDCPLHEHWEFCTGHCQRNCSNWSKALICPDICIQGCLCDWGFTRGPKGDCIPVSECPPIEEEEPTKVNVYYKCKENEHFSECRDQKECEKNCSNYEEEIPCTSCEPGCICDEGFVRSQSGKCIPMEECQNPSMPYPFQSSKTSAVRICKKNEHLSPCDGLPLCQRSCSNYKESIVCPLICVPGCVCDEGYVIGPSGECVLLEECPFNENSPTVQELKPHRSPVPRYLQSKDYESFTEVPSIDSEVLSFIACPANEQWSQCLGHCQRTCSNYNEALVCPMICVPGCICNEGFVRGPRGVCITVGQCPPSLMEFQPLQESKQLSSEWSLENGNAQSSDVSPMHSEDEDFCSLNEIFSPCLAHCQKNCTNWDDPTMPCVKMCVPGCICTIGLVRGPYGNCINPRQCPLTPYLQDTSEKEFIDCPVNEHFDQCKAHCQKDCSNWDQEIKCKPICVSGCVCDKGFVRGPSGKCILEEKCSSLQQKSKGSLRKKNLSPCPEGEERSVVLSIDDSDLFCMFRNGTLQLCPPTYLKGCVCRKGEIRGEDSRCIDRRLLPHANEIHFMHGGGNGVVHQDSQESSKEFSDFVESRKKSAFDTTTFTSATISTLSNLNDEISSSVPTEASVENRVNADLEPHGCPDSEKCVAWCRKQGSISGACTRGWSHKFDCICFHF